MVPRGAVWCGGVVWSGEAPWCGVVSRVVWQSRRRRVVFCGTDNHPRRYTHGEISSRRKPHCTGTTPRTPQESPPDLIKSTPFLCSIFRDPYRVPGAALWGLGWISDLGGTSADLDQISADLGEISAYLDRILPGPRRDIGGSWLISADLGGIPGRHALVL